MSGILDNPKDGWPIIYKNCCISEELMLDQLNLGDSVGYATNF